MKYRRSWLPPRAGSIAVDPGGARPGTIHRTNPSQLNRQIEELKALVQASYLRTPQQTLRLIGFGDGWWPPQLQGERSGKAAPGHLKWPLLAASALCVAISGCSISTTNHGWPGSYAPPGVPNAQDCVPISFGQPTEFACPNGKVYTAQQLKSLREPKATGKTVASAGY